MKIIILLSALFLSKQSLAVDAGLEKVDILTPNEITIAAKGRAKRVTRGIRITRGRG
jgi:hypothetical protein